MNERDDFTAAWLSEERRLQSVNGDNETATWAHDLLDAAIRRGDATSVQMLKDLAEAAPDDDSLFHVGAGPVEFLLNHWSAAEALLPMLDIACRVSARLGLALRSASVHRHVAPLVRDWALRRGAIDGG